MPGPGDVLQLSDSTRGLVFNIQHFSIHDGPGIRTTVFMKCCPLRCPWCSNPESQEYHPEIMTVDRNCIKCGKCAEVCHQGAITLDESGRTIDREKCDNCLMCSQVCPTGAIETAGSYMDIDKVMTEIEKDEIFYRNSGGGMTISGGEPLMQWKFVLELFKECKTKGFHTALDTSGYAQWNVMEKVVEYADLVLHDIKLIDSTQHETATGVANDIIMANTEKVARRKRTWLRYAVVPGFNDSESCAREIAAFASRVQPEKVSLLPYHALGAQKYEKLGRAYSLNGVLPPSNERLHHIARVFQSSGVDVTIGF